MPKTCACCGNPIPEWQNLCSDCDTWSAAPDAFLPDGTPLYLKTTTQKSSYGSLQLELYDRLLKGEKT